MRIELNSGGLTGTASLSTMQSEITALLGGADVFLSALRSVKSYTCNINGGVGSLQVALDEVESRIQTAEIASSNLNAAKDKIGSFIELTKKVDLTVSGLVNRNKHEFYNLNEWSRPLQKEEEKEWYEKLYDWACGVGDSIAETAQKAWNGIKSFCSSVKEKLDELFAGFQEWWKDHTTITPTVIEDEVFDTKKKNPACSGSENNKGGMYGSWQGAPAYIATSDGVISEREQEYLEVLQRRLSHEEYELISNNDVLLDNYLDELESNGCGYAAMVNTVFEYYCNRSNGAEEFEAKFGFSLRNSDGLLNYDLMMVDIYSYENGYGHSSTNMADRKRILTNYMQDTGADGHSSVNVDIKNNVSFTVNNYDNYIREGKQIIVRADRFKLYDENGNLAGSCGAHAMVITGVTEDGKFIVSSWGKKYMIDPNDVGEKVYWSENGKKQSDKVGNLSFAVVDYH